MKIRKVTCWLLRIPFTFPLVKETQHVLANFVEVETDDGLKGHSLSTYPLKYGIREFINVRDIGGYTQGLKAAAIAQAFNVRSPWAATTRISTCICTAERPTAGGWSSTGRDGSASKRCSTAPRLP